MQSYLSNAFNMYLELFRGLKKSSRFQFTTGTSLFILVIGSEKRCNPLRSINKSYFPFLKEEVKLRFIFFAVLLINILSNILFFRLYFFVLCKYCVQSNISALYPTR